MNALLLKIYVGVTAESTVVCPRQQWLRREWVTMLLYSTIFAFLNDDNVMVSYFQFLLTDVNFVPRDLK
jgi:hypothetical protein